MGLAGAGFGAVVNAAIEAGGKLFELSQKLHVSTESLSALHFAANQLESSAGAVDAAIAKMAVTLGKAAQGSDQAVIAFNNLGIDFNKLLALPVDQQFLAIVDALNKMQDSSERAATAQAIFGKGSRELSALLAAGTDKIIEMGQEAARTGAIITSDMVTALDDAGDSINAFSASWEALKMQLVATGAPVITFVMNEITGVISRARAAWFALEYAMTTGIQLIVMALDQLQAAWNAVVPKAMELDRQPAEQLIDSLTKKRQEIANKGLTLAGFRSADNPLARSGSNVGGHVTTKAEQKAADKTAKEAAKAAERTAKATEKLANERPVRLVVAGVR